jgi:hypothetical protein
MILFQVMSLKTLPFPCLGPMLFLMVGPWSGTHPQPTLIMPSDVMPGLSMMSVLLSYFKFRCRELETLKLVCNNFYQFGTYATFGNSCNINACDIKYDGDCISGLAFVRGTLFDPAFGGLSGRYPTGQGVTAFEVRMEPLRERTCVLEPV